MSKFLTTIPVNVDAVKQSLPKQSLVQSVRLGDDKKSIVIEWDCDDLITPFTIPVEMSPEALAGREPMPTCVKKREGFKRVQNPIVEQTPSKRKKSAQ